jgi:LEA14-like dessication related protein
MKKKSVCLILAVLFVAIFVPGCDTVQQALLGAPKPSATLKGLSFGDISLNSATLLFDVDIKNPYAVDLPLLNMDYGVASSGNKLFTGTADIASTIPAKGTKTVSLPAKLSYADVAKAFMGYKSGSAIPYDADLGLSFDTPVVGKLRVPLNKSGQLTVPNLSDLKKVDWQKMILDKTTGTK